MPSSPINLVIFERSHARGAFALLAHLRYRSIRWPTHTIRLWSMASLLPFLLRFPNPSQSRPSSPGPEYCNTHNVHLHRCPPTPSTLASFRMQPTSSASTSVHCLRIVQTPPCNCRVRNARAGDHKRPDVIQEPQEIVPHMRALRAVPADRDRTLGAIDGGKLGLVLEESRQTT
ncbi:hypothetical protein BC937DRAFT_94851 [Endogone sp. FLAS-F59071]|nr:hypothetical protein BC937DRAFT_94851 [Endogone sp. FLAS-F59071]|eukprot:RUS20599.1 hypothetical protein BC937DRAFT_94851 [Endogone sp. FLAS-F59071]